jgi:DNA-directed RNA polymerase subunit H
MHALQSKHTKLSQKEVKELLERLNIALTQLPKISKKDPALTENCETGDVVKISRKDEEYYRVVI